MHGLKLSNMVKNKVGSVEILPRRGTWINKGDVSRSTANHTAKGAHTAKENALDTARNSDPAQFSHAAIPVDTAIHVDTAIKFDTASTIDPAINVDMARIIETAMKVDRLDTARIIDTAKNEPSTVDRENGGSFDSSKVKKTSDATTNGIHASNTANSYADMAKKFGVDSDSLGTKVNFRYMVNVESKQGFDVVLPKDSIRAVCNKLEFTLYGYFLGDRCWNRYAQETY
ncbi:hypothetical protein QVD17_16652 [Tagetes erecta]|uniref:Uncharacterized protein n=1 Tax=Tagetes erecta TaxID=13708 RepID=A0AAD8KSJ0_TARER|nr:hypothetical protein QVD17_16652 [Tagetes erecta]